MNLFLLISAAFLTLVGVVSYKRKPKEETRNINITGFELAEILDGHKPHIELEEVGTFYFKNGSWWQKWPTLFTPAGRPVKLLFTCPNPHEITPPTHDQIDLFHTIYSEFDFLWNDMEKSFRRFFAEKGDSALFENSTKWELEIDASEGGTRWTVSFKVPGGQAAWYQRSYNELKGSVVTATY